MNAEKSGCYVSLEITHPDPVTRQLYFEQLQGFKSLLEDAESWNWNKEEIKETGQAFCSINKTLNGVNIFRREDWPDIISFLKASVIELDAFWWLAKDLIEIL